MGEPWPAAPADVRADVHVNIMPIGQDDLEFFLEEAFLQDEEAQQAAAAEEDAAVRPPAGPDDSDSGAAAAVVGPAPRPPPGTTAEQPPPQGSSRLAALSEPVLFRALCFLSPDDLLSLAQTSAFFRAWASEPLLWRRAYAYRWAEGPRAGEDDALPWKEQYIERDRTELAAAMSEATAPALRPVYVQMAKAKRSEAAGLPPAADPFPAPDLPASAALRWRVDAWRRERGLTDAARHAAHSCGGGCTFVRLDDGAGDVWLCDRSGFLHHCTDNCGEREMDPSGDLLICPISGRCFQRWLTPAEEAGGDAERGQSRAEEEDGGDWNAEEGMGGRLGRAYYAGYNCADEAELQSKFGIRFR